MGYRIEYGQSLKKETVHPFPIFKIKKATVYTALIVVAVIIFLLCIGTESIRSFILPGDPVVTEHALNTFAEQIRVGEPLKDAAAAFCHEIIVGANIA